MELIKKYFFHRSIFLVIAILIQLLVLIGVILRFYNYFIYFYGINMVISIVAVLIILNNDMNLVYKVAWIIPVLLFPIFGIVFYMLFGGKKLGKRPKKEMQSISKKTRELLNSHNSIIKKMELENKNAANQSKYIQNYASYPPYLNEVAEYFIGGEKKFERLKEELKKAEKFIFLEYFIIEEGEMWNSILEILKMKIAEGVEVRIIYDDFGCLLKLPYKYNNKLEKLGIKTAVFNPLNPVLSSKHNNRDHRKIAIIDGHTAFTGGINLADEYINLINKFGHWKDSAIMIKGKAVWSMTVMFLSMWHHLKGNKENFKKYKYNPEISHISQKKPDGYIQPFGDSPLDNEAVSEIVYLNMINKAKDYIYITTPYLIIDSKMVTALTSAAKAGVDVRIITPHKPDKWYVHLVTRSYYKELINNGVKIYEYTPGFIHSKIFISDDKYGVIGTINMDYRSLYLHFECGVWLYDCNIIGEMKKDFLNILQVSKEITKENYSVENKKFKALAGSVLRVFAPLM
ncbi:MAG: cardiolipin synthase [Bacillota bacterium]